MKRIAGIPLIDSALARDAYALAASASPEWLLNHSLRTYVFGSLIGKARRLRLDREAFYVACLFHDLGLTARFEGDLPFEIQGAEAARHFLDEHDVRGKRAELIWDGIAMHASAISAFKRPEVALLGDGTTADVLDPREVPEAAVAETLAAFPRLNFSNEFLAACAGVVQRHPAAASRGFMRDIGERLVPDFHPVNFCDRVWKD